MHTKDGWLAGILRKRPLDGIVVLADCCRAGLERGECSALDVRDRQFKQPNIVGATMRGTLRQSGFRHTDRRVKSKVKRKHARKVDVWVLIDPSKARAIESAAAKILLDAEEKERARTVTPYLPGI